LGNSEIAQVRSLLGQAILHALKVARWPEHPSADHWFAEALTFLDQAQERYRPSMRGEIDVARSFARARRTVLAMPMRFREQPLPELLGLTLDALMDDQADLRTLIEAIGRGDAAGPRE
jgi:hypothetical protein